MHHNNYIKQIFEEGLGTTFYQKPKLYIEKNFTNNILKSIFLACLYIFYIAFIIAVAILLFNFNFPF